MLWTADSSRSRSRSSRARARAKEGRLELVHFTDLEQVACVRSDHSYVFSTSLPLHWPRAGRLCPFWPQLCLQHELVHSTDLEQVDCVRSDYSYVRHLVLFVCVFSTSLFTTLTSSRKSVLSTATLACSLQHEFVHFADLEQVDCLFWPQLRHRILLVYVFNTSLSTSLTWGRQTDCSDNSYSTGSCLSVSSTRVCSLHWPRAGRLCPFWPQLPGLACLCLQHEFVHFSDLEQVDSVLTTATAPGLAYRLCSDHSHSTWSCL